MPPGSMVGVRLIKSVRAILSVRSACWGPGIALWRRTDNTEASRKIWYISQLQALTRLPLAGYINPRGHLLLSHSCLHKRFSRSQQAKKERLVNTLIKCKSHNSMRPNGFQHLDLSLISWNIVDKFKYFFLICQLKKVNFSEMPPKLF